MKKLLLGLGISALAILAVRAQHNPCVAYSVTNCSPRPSIALAPVSSITASVCGTVSASTVNITNAGKVVVTSVDESCAESHTTIATNYPTILSNWTVVYWNSQRTTNAGLSAAFTPANPGSGTITFYAKYTTPGPCAGLYTTNRIVSVTVTNRAPLITTQPTNQTVIAGNSATFSVSACGAGLGYQWRFNGASLPGATASSFTTNNVQAGSAGTYTVVIANTAGSTTSTDAVLTVLVTPAIVSSPASQTVTAGNDAVLRVTAIGTSLGYQWYHNSEAIWGATESVLYLANAQDGDAGTYTVEVTQEATTVTSDPAVVTVVPAVPVAMPQGVVAWWCAEDDFSVSGTAEDQLGNNPGTARSYLDEEPGKIGYAFGFNGGSADLLIPAKDPAQGGLNSSTWEGFTIEGWIKPTDVSTAQPILEQWDSESGYRITLSLAAYAPGSLDLTYVDSGGTHFLYSPEGVLWPNAFQHIAIAYENHLGTVFLKLYVNGQLVAQNTDPLEMPLGTNDIFFGSTPSGSFLTQWDTPQYYAGLMDELTVYNRALDATEIAGIYTASTAGKIPQCRQVSSGCVSWWQAEGNGADVYALNPAVVDGGVTFTAGQKGQAFTFAGTASVRVPASTTLNVGPGAGFTLEAWVKPGNVSAAQPIFEWNAAGFTGVAVWISDTGNLSADIPDEALIDNLLNGDHLTANTFQHVALTYDSSDTTGRLYLNGRQVGSMGCIFLLPILTRGDFCIGFSPNDDLGTGTQFAGQIDEAALYTRALSGSEIRRLYTAGCGGKCGLAPNILTQPQSQTAHAGNNVAFQVVAAGTSLTYQWSRNSVAISGATTSALTLMNLQTSQAGTYSVAVANDVSSVLSSGATLVVNPTGNGTPPTITTQPASLSSACEGGPVELSVTATGNGTLTYQWCKNTININGATASNYALSQVSSPDQATYTVIVYDTVGHITSADAVLTVHPRPTAAITGGGTIHPGGSETADIQTLLTGTGPWTLRWSDGQTETVPAIDNPHHRQVAPSTTTTYSLLALSDTYCSARTSELGDPVEVKVDGPNLDWPMRAGFTYLEAGTYNNYTFGGDMMFYVDGEVTLSGTTTFEGGTVVYFAPLSDSTARIIITGPVVCDTAPYRPATFASSDRINYIWYFDDPSTPMTDYYGQGLSIQTTSATVLKHCRFFNLGCGLSLDSATACTLYNCQFADCDTAIAQNDAGATLNLYNALFCDDNTVIALGAAAQAPQINFQHITVDNCGSFASGLPATPAGTWTGKNSLLVNVHNASTIPSNLQRDPNNCPTISSSSGVFVTAGDGSHYLADNTYRGQGTLTGLDATLVSEFPQKTTRPPMTLPLDFETGGSITLSPQVPRYTTGAPDLGYQYEVLDYTLSDFIVDPGGQVTVLPGTAIGIRYDWVPGFQLLYGATFVSEGTPTRPNTFVAVSAVQEGPFPQFFWYPGFQISFIPCYWPEVVADPERCPDYNAAGDPPPTLRFRFSNLYLGAGFSYHLWGGMAMPSFYGLIKCASYDSAMFLSMRDCALHGGWFHLGEPHGGVIPPVFQPGWDPWWEQFCGPPIPGSVCWFNNLFDRVNISLDPDTGPAYWGGPYELPTIDLCVTATNNLFHGGWLFMEPFPNCSAGNWVFQNNLFDKTVFAQDANQPLNQDYNGYWQCTSGELLSGQMDKLKPDAAHDVLLDAAPPYVSSYLGRYYLPDTLPGTPQLFGAGICPPADVGLYHYTTCAAQTKEGEITPPHNANIGLHYIAVETTGPHSGQPKDYDSDGIPDYVADADGDGVWDSNEPPPGPMDPRTLANDDISAVEQDSSDSPIPVLANDTDSGGGALSIFTPAAPTATAHGNVRPAPDYQGLLYTPNPGFYGQDTFSYVALGGSYRTASATVRVLVNKAGNHPPVCQDDQATLALGQTSVTLNILANDTDADSDPISIYSLGTCQLGTVQDQGSGTILYTRPASVYGVDVFRYIATDGNGGYATAQVTISRLVAPTTVAAKDFLQVDQDTSSNPLDVLANDADSEGYALSISSPSSATPTPHGSVAPAPDNLSLLYTPTAGFFGSDTFNYTVSNGHGRTASAAAVVLVNNTAAGNNNPIAGEWSVTLPATTPPTPTVTISKNDILANCSDPDSDTLTIYSIEPPSIGTATDNGMGGITYTRTAGKYGTDRFACVISDGRGGYATANVEVNQTDTDGDGMPDDWEAATGLDTLTDDRTLDPDADGLPNLAEYFLRTDPQVPDNPLDLSLITLPNTVSGGLQIPLRISSDAGSDGDGPLSLSLLVDGAPARTRVLKTINGWLAEWDTTSTRNGPHQLSLRLACPIDGSPPLVVSGAPKTAIVLNAVTIADLSRAYTDYLIIDASVSVPASTYEIEVYDAATASHLTTLSGTVAGSKITTFWDLLDGSGVKTSASSLRCDFYLFSPPQAKSAAPAATTLHTSLPSIQGQAFTVAYGFDYGRTMMNRLQTAMLNSVVNNLNTLCDLYGDGTDYELLPTGAGGNVPYGTAFQWVPGDWTTRSMLTNALANPSSANFYWWGHANTAVIAPHRKKAPQLLATEVGKLLGNSWSLAGGWIKTQRSYRLVILDGCLSYSIEWASAFGVCFTGVGRYTSATFQNLYHRDPQALVGWEVETPAPMIPSSINGLEDSLGYLWVWWQTGARLDECMVKYTDKLVEHGFDQDGGFLGIGANGIADVKEYRISGCIDLTTYDR